MAKRVKVTREFVLQNRQGLHARPASMIAKTAGRFSAAVHIAKDGQSLDAKSVLALLTMAAGHGTTLAFTAEGEDTAEALNALERLIADKFNEE